MIKLYSAYRNRFIYGMLTVTGIVVLIMGLSHWRKSYSCNGIAHYNAQRDRQALLKLFRDNWYWLIPEGSLFNAEEFLDKHDPNLNAEGPEHTKIMVYCVNDKPIGFVGYHRESFYKGRIRFIAIDESYRGQGYSQKLMDYALQDLKAHGCVIVQLLTRTNNQRARQLYTQLGFKPYQSNDRFIYFEKTLEDASLAYA
jgi:ribosomal protein S18 acetylase RimI-like enzyme